MSFLVRRASQADLPGIHVLSEVLGYPAPLSSTSGRLQELLLREDHAIYVAAGEHDDVIGWAHAFLYRLLVSDLQCYVGGLVVDPQHQRRGVGRGLMRAVERWASQRACTRVRVNSNIVREDAHSFYLDLGYRHFKQQHAFVKGIKAGSRD